jgi:hypothetical protein
MPSMPPPPPCPPGIGASFFSGISATRASVVSINDAIEPALVSAVRTNFEGSGGLLRVHRCLRRRRAAQQSFGAQVFVQVGPVNPISSASNLPIPALRRCGVKQARIPYQRHCDDAPIPQTHAERIGRGLHVQHSLICHRCRKTHSMPPGKLADVPSPLIVSCAVRARDTHNFAPVELSQARI